MKTIKDFSEFIKLVVLNDYSYNDLDNLFVWRDNDDLNKASYYMYTCENYRKNKGMFNAWHYFDIKNNVHVTAEENKKGIFEITKIEKNIHKF